MSAYVLLAMRVHCYPIEVDGDVAAANIADNDGAIVTFCRKTAGYFGHPVMVGNHGFDSTVRRQFDAEALKLDAWVSQ